MLLLSKYNKVLSNISFKNDLFDNKEYYSSVNKSYKENNIKYFIIYLLKNIDESLSLLTINRIVNDEDIKLNKILNVMEYNKPMTAYEIMDKLNIKSKETFRNTYLNEAIKKGFIFLTKPDKPTSRYQMYYRK